MINVLKRVVSTIFGVETLYGANKLESLDSSIDTLVNSRNDLCRELFVNGEVDSYQRFHVATKVVIDAFDYAIIRTIDDWESTGYPTGVPIGAILAEISDCCHYNDLDGALFFLRNHINTILVDHVYVDGDTYYLTKHGKKTLDTLGLPRNSNLTSIIRGTLRNFQ